MTTTTAPAAPAARTAEVRFTAKRAAIWNRTNGRWQAIARDTAAAMIATGEAVELKAGEWV